MKLDRASEILEKHGVVDEETTWGDYLKAADLGSKALKGIIAIRCGAISDVNEPLPGETEE